MTFGDTLALYRQRLQVDPSIKSRTKAYRQEPITAMLKSWPGLEALDVRRISKADCLAWADRYGTGCSPSNFNNSIGTLRMILSIAVEAGALYDNPARFIKRHKVRLKQLQLPSHEQFRQFVAGHP